MRIRLETIGCRLNIGEMEMLARQLASLGHRVVPPGEAADLCLLNTCTVTSTAARKSRKALHQLRRSHPNAVLVATGCFSELEPHAAREIGADLVIANSEKESIPEALDAAGILDAANGDDDSSA